MTLSDFDAFIYANQQLQLQAVSPNQGRLLEHELKLVLFIHQLASFQVANEQ